MEGLHSLMRGGLNLKAVVNDEFRGLPAPNDNEARTHRDMLAQALDSDELFAVCLNALYHRRQSAYGRLSNMDLHRWVSFDFYVQHFRSPLVNIEFTNFQKNQISFSDPFPKYTRYFTHIMVFTPTMSAGSAQLQKGTPSRHSHQQTVFSISLLML